MKDVFTDLGVRAEDFHFKNESSTKVIAWVPGVMVESATANGYGKDIPAALENLKEAVEAGQKNGTLHTDIMPPESAKLRASLKEAKKNYCPFR